MDELDVIQRMWPFRKSLVQLAERSTDGELVQAVRDRLPRRYEEFTHIQRGLWAAWWLKAETNNGGAEQYFTNSTADDYPVLCRFLQEIEAHETHDALIRFGQYFGRPDDSFPEREQRIDFVDEQRAKRGDEWRLIVSNATGELRSTFKSLSEKLAKHIRANLESTEG